MQNTREGVLFDGKMSKMLMRAALGDPHLLIVQAGTGPEAEITDGFDMDNLFNFIVAFARNNEDFKKVLIDYIIELSKEIE